MKDRTIVLETVPGEPKKRKLFIPFPCEMMDGSFDIIPYGYVTDGSSTPVIFRWLIPRHDHPINSTEHDYRSGKARNAKERAWADNQYRVGIKNTKAPSRLKRTWLKTQSVAGYIGVRIGAFFGVGSNY